jgi:L-fuconolactonase
MRIDAHQHFWGPYEPDLLWSILKRNRFDGSITVQSIAGIAETQRLFGLANANPFIRGVIAWVDLNDPNLGNTLDQLQQHDKFKGVQWEPESDDAALPEGLLELGARGLTLDLLLRPQHLQLIPRIADRAPMLRMAIDHIARPDVEGGVTAVWAQGMEAAAQIPQVYCKLSALSLLDAPKWHAAALQPFVRHLMALFGYERLMFGSGWPACLEAGRWKESLACFTQAIGAHPMKAREKLLGCTAKKFYLLAPTDASASEASA